jgi:hypothetical protein
MRTPSLVLSTGWEEFPVIPGIVVIIKKGPGRPRVSPGPWLGTFLLRSPEAPGWSREPVNDLHFCWWSSAVNVHSDTIHLLMWQARAISLLPLRACLNLLKDEGNRSVSSAQGAVNNPPSPIHNYPCRNGHIRLVKHSRRRRKPVREVTFNRMDRDKSRWR